MKRTSLSSFLPGLFVITLGVGFLGSALNLFEFGSIVSMWWPIALIVASLVIALEGGNKLWAGIVLIVGASLQLQMLGLLEVSIWSLFWPVIMILVGISLLPRFFRGKIEAKAGTPLTAFFGGLERRLSSVPKGVTTVSAVFGGVELDMSKADIADGAIVEATALFGGIELKVPDCCEVQIQGTPLFGGVDDSTSHPEKPECVLVIDARAVFGGVSVTN